MRLLRITLILTLVLTATACGDEPETAGGIGEATPTPTEVVEDGTGEPDGDPADQTGGERPGTPGGRAGTTATSAPVQRAPAAGVNQPRTGDFVYAATGSSAWEPGGSGEFRQTVTVSARGDEFTLRTSSDRPTDGVTTVRTRWEEERVQLLSMRIEIPGERYECTFEPEISIIRLPIRAQSYPSQTGRGQDCQVTAEIRVVGQEEVEVPAGTFRTWKIESTTRYRFGSDVSGTVTGTNWFSPDLGFEVQGDRTQDSTFKGQQSRSTVKTQLRSHP